MSSDDRRRRMTSAELFRGDKTNSGYDGFINSRLMKWKSGMYVSHVQLSTGEPEASTVRRGIHAHRTVRRLH
jgi:hypothetical protein